MHIQTTARAGDPVNLMPPRAAAGTPLARRRVVVEPADEQRNRVVAAIRGRPCKPETAGF